MKRLLVVLLVVLLAVPATVAGGATATDTSVAPALQEDDDSTPTPDDENGTATPSLAEQVRFAPLDFGEQYSSITTGEAGSAYNITGRSAGFATTLPVEAVRMTQPGGEARILDGDQTIQLEWQPDASPDSESYYTLELFFADDSTRTVDLYVSGTATTTVPPSVANGQGLIEDLQDQAEDAGYEGSLAGIRNWQENLQQRASVFDNFLAGDLTRIQNLFILYLSTGLLLFLTAVGLILLSRRLLSKHGRKLRSLAESQLSQLRRNQLVQRYRRDEEQAAESRLEDVDKIGTGAVHYREQLGVATESQLGELLAAGKPAVDGDGRLLRLDPSADDVDPVRDHTGDVVIDEEGNELGPLVRTHEGIEDIERALQNGEPLEETWIEPIIRDQHLGSARRFLAESKYVLQRLAEKHGLPKYREPYQRVATALDHLQSGTGRLESGRAEEDRYTTAARGDD